MDPNLLNQARSIIGGGFTPPGFPSPPGGGNTYPIQQKPITPQTPPSQEYMNSMIKKLGDQIQALWAAGDKTGQADKLNTLREQLVHGDYSNLPPQNVPQPPPGGGLATPPGFPSPIPGVPTYPLTKQPLPENRTSQPPTTGYTPGPWDNITRREPLPTTGYQSGPWDNMARPAAPARTYTPYARQLQGQMSQNMMPTNNVKYGNIAGLLNQFGKK